LLRATVRRRREASRQAGTDAPGSPGRVRRIVWPIARREDAKLITHPSMRMVVLAAVCIAAGCGGTSEPRLTKAAFLKQGNAICAKGTRKIERVGLAFFKTPGRPTAKETIAFARNVALPTTQSELDHLRALRPPKDDRATVKTLIDKAQAAVDRVSNDPSLLGRPNGSDEANTLARAYGLTACAG
jgi:hypothetical protein